MVGKVSRILVSSVTRTLPPRTSIGTLKSTRTSTRFPRTSTSRRVSFAILTLTLARALLSKHLEHFDAAIAVAPLVVVPADHFHETIAEHDRQFAIEDARVWIADDILRDEWLVAVFEHAFVTFVGRSLFERGVHGVDGGVFFQDHAKISHRTVGRWHSKRAAI